MGYYTDFNLSVSCATMKDGVFRETTIESASPERCKELEDEIKKMDVFESVSVNPKCRYGGAWGNAKWYECASDMLALSARFPEFFFSLNGAGEEQGDLWNAYFFQGKMQECCAQIIWPEFDPSKLTSPVNKSVLSPNYRYSYE